MLLCSRGNESVLVVRKPCVGWVAEKTGKWCAYYLYTFNGIVGDPRAFVHVTWMFHDKWVKRRADFTKVKHLDDTEYQFLQDSADACVRNAP